MYAVASLPTRFGKTKEHEVNAAKQWKAEAERLKVALDKARQDGYEANTARSKAGDRLVKAERRNVQLNDKLDRLREQWVTVSHENTLLRADMQRAKDEARRNSGVNRAPGVKRGPTIMCGEG